MGVIPSALKGRGCEYQAPPSNARWVFTWRGQRNTGALKRRGRHEQSWAATEHTQVTANSLTGQEARDGVEEAVEVAWERMANNTPASKNIEYVTSLQYNTVKAT